MLFNTFLRIIFLSGSTKNTSLKFLWWMLQLLQHLLPKSLCVCIAGCNYPIPNLWCCPLVILSVCVWYQSGEHDCKNSFILLFYFMLLYIVLYSNVLYFVIFPPIWHYPMGFEVRSSHLQIEVNPGLEEWHSTRKHFSMRVIFLTSENYMLKTLWKSYTILNRKNCRLSSLKGWTDYILSYWLEMTIIYSTDSSQTTHVVWAVLCSFLYATCCILIATC